MDQDTIRNIAQEVAQQLPLYSWQLLAIQVLLTMAAFVGGMLFADHLRARTAKAPADGSHQVTDPAPQESPAQENWREREWANLRRSKLETLLSRVHDCEHFASVQATSATERDPLSELEVITTLYFPELKTEVEGYLGLCRARKLKGSDAAAIDQPSLQYPNFETARDQLSAAARNLTTQIMGVENTA